MLDIQSHVPAYVQLKQFYLKKIQNKELVQGDKLPSEQEICAQWGVSKMTVRQGLQQLVKEGFLMTRRGVGIFVSGSTVELDTFRFTSFSSRSKASIETKVFTFKKEPLTLEQSMEYFNAKYSFAWYSERLRLLDGAPAMYEISRMPYELFPGLKKSHLEKSKYKFVMKSSLAPIASSERIFIAEILAEHIAVMFNLPKNTPAIKIISQGVLADDKIFENVILYHHPNFCIIKGRSPFFSI